MTNGTSCEPTIGEVDLSKHGRKIENKQNFMCLNHSDKLKRSWSEENHIKQSTRTVQPYKKSGKCNIMHSFVECVVASHWDAGSPLTKTDICDLMNDKYCNSNHFFAADILKFKNYLSSFCVFLHRSLDRCNFSARSNSISHKVLSDWKDLSVAKSKEIRALFNEKCGSCASL